MGWPHHLRPAVLAGAVASLLWTLAAPAGGGSGPPALTATPAPRAPRRAAVRAVRQWRHDWAKGAVFYEVFVRSFADSDDDGVGDLPGLIGKLDYLNDGDPATAGDLGVEALWLMPVFASPSYHGYDVTDYETINPAYGTNEDFARLAAEAHRRGIRIILDLVVNHSSEQHPWFVESSSSPSSPRRDWYVWSVANPGWTQPWGTSPAWHGSPTGYYYGIFWSGMPDLNFTSAAVREEIKRLAGVWVDRGADGFRLDAARYLVETGPGAGQQDTAATHAYWKELAASLRARHPETVLVGENWTTTPIIATYYGSAAVVAGGDELPASFDFPLADALRSGIASGNAASIAAVLADVKRLYPAGATDAPFLTNHDQVRLATQLGNVPSRLRNAAAILLTLPGSPFLYYGEEVGIQNGTTSGDESKRTPMPWDGSSGGGFTTGTPWFPFAPGRDAANVAAQSQDPGSLLSRYRALIRARQASSALRRGDIELLGAGGSFVPVLAFLRSDAPERAFVVHNVTDSFAIAGPFAFTTAGFDRLFADAGVSDPLGGNGAWRVNLPPRTTGIWRLR